MAKVEIKQDGLQTHIILDGKDISHMVRAFSFGRDATEVSIPILHLDINALDLAVDSDCVVRLPEAFASFAKQGEGFADPKDN